MTGTDDEDLLQFKAELERFLNQKGERPQELENMLAQAKSCQLTSIIINSRP